MARAVIVVFPLIVWVVGSNRIAIAYFSAS